MKRFDIYNIRKICYYNPPAFLLLVSRNIFINYLPTFFLPRSWKSFNNLPMFVLNEYCLLQLQIVAHTCSVIYQTKQLVRLSFFSESARKLVRSQRLVQDWLDSGQVVTRSLRTISLIILYLHFCSLNQWKYKELKIILTSSFWWALVFWFQTYHPY